MGRERVVAQTVLTSRPLECDPPPPEVTDALVTGREALLREVCLLNGGVEPSNTELAEARQRLAVLATSADRVGVSFAGAPVHYAYFDSKFVLRGTLVFQTLRQLQLEHPGAVGLLLSTQRSVHIASMGGGPGTDVAGVAGFVAHTRSRCAVEVTLYDRERSWRRYLACLQRIMENQLHLSFEPCDVRFGCSAPAEVHDTDAFSHPNKQLAAKAQSTDVFLFSFVANETACAALASGWAFYHDLARLAPVGALFIFLDVRHHSAPVLDAICAAVSLKPLVLSRSAAAETRVLVKA